MKSKFFKIFIVVVMIAGIGFWAAPKTYAFFDTLNAGIQAIGHTLQNFLQGTDTATNVAGHGVTATTEATGATANVSAQVGAAVAQVTTTNVDPAGAGNKAASVAVEASGAPCTGIEKAEQIASTADTGLINSFALVAGSAGAVAKLNARIAALTAVRSCREFQKAAVVGATPEASLSLSNKTVGKQQELQAQIDSLSTRIERLKELANAEAKDFLRAILTRVASKFAGDLTMKFANGVMSRYKISNYMQYFDAVANQVYTVDYINKNYKGDAATALMLKSLATNSLAAPQLQKATQTFAKNKALQYAGASCISGAVLSDPNFYQAMARCGNTEANPLFQTMSLNQQAGAVKAAARSATDKETGNNELVPQRECSGSVQLQQQNEAKFDQLNKQAIFDYEVYERVDKAYHAVLANKQLLANSMVPDPKTGTFVSDGSYDKAVAEAKKQRDLAYEKWQASANGLEKLPGKSPSEPLEALCQVAIKTPAKFISDVVSNQVEAWLGESAKLSQDTLPTAISRFADVATSLITGLINGGSPGQLLKEAGLQGLGLATQGLTQTFAESRNNADSSANSSLLGNGPQAPQVVISAPDRVAAGSTYVLKVDLSALSAASTIKPTRFALKVDGSTYDDDRLNAGETILTYDVTADAAIPPNGKITYSVDIFGRENNDSEGNQVVIGSASKTINVVPAGTSVGYIRSGGNVAGAVSGLQIRGPAVKPR